MEYQATGRLPVVNPPSSPLITLLQSLHPQERLRIASVAISPPMGYTGSRIFQNAQQALIWPLSAGLPRNVPSQSWQDKRFRRPLTVDDLGHHATVPADVAEAWWCRPLTCAGRSRECCSDACRNCWTRLAENGIAYQSY